MPQYKQKLNTRTGQFNLVPNATVLVFKESVATQNNLPLSGNTLGDARVTDDTCHLYVWSVDSSTGILSDWSDQGDIIDINWSAIIGKPNSSVADIDSAVSLKHASGSDNQVASTVDTNQTGKTVQDELDELELIKHSHSNKTILDNIQEALTTALKSAYDGAVSLAHALHSDDQDASQVPTSASGVTVQDNLNTLNGEAHTHSNKTILDQIQEALTTALKSAYDGVVTAFGLHKDATTGVHGVGSGDTIAKFSDINKTNVGLSNVDNVSEATIISDTKSDSDVADALSKKHASGSDNQTATTVPTSASGISVQDNLDTLNGEAHTHSNKATLDSTQEAFTTALKTKLDDIVNPMLFKGNIAVAADFPTLVLVQNGWTYNTTADVTDNDITKTNTGLSFSAKTEIAWNGSTWIELGYSDVKSVNNKTGIVSLNAGDVGAIKEAVDTYTDKVTPVATDLIPLQDSEVTDLPIKKLSWSNIKSTLKTYFDAIYTLANLGGVPTTRQVSGHQLTGDVTVTLGDVGGESAGTTSTHNGLDNGVHGVSGSGNRVAGLLDITKANVGLSAVTNDAQVKASQLVRGTFTNGDLSAGVLTVTHSLALSSPYTVHVVIFDNNNKMIIPDEITGATSTVAIDLTSFGSLTGTYGYLILG